LDFCTKSKILFFFLQFSITIPQVRRSWIWSQSVLLGSRHRASYLFSER